MAFGIAGIISTAPVGAQTPHCFNSLNGPEVACTPRAGAPALATPAPSIPSPRQVANEINRRGIDAEARGDETSAIRFFEEALRHTPENQIILRNLANAKGMVAYQHNDFNTAAAHFKTALAFAPNDKVLLNNLKAAERVISLRAAMDDVAAKNAETEPFKEKARAAEAAGDFDVALVNYQAVNKVCVRQNHGGRCNGAELAIHRALGRRAAQIKDWDTAIRELKAAQAIYGEYVVQRLTDVFSDEERPAQYLEAALKAKAREPLAATGLSGSVKNTGPIVREPGMPRSYPDLGNYTASQHEAHQANEQGNVWAMRGDWVHAMLSYEQALSQDPYGPFSKVLRENREIAIEHLRDDASPAISQTATNQKLEQPGGSRNAEGEQQEIVQENCTRWMGPGGDFRLCMDEQSHQRYCERSDGNAVSRVACQ